MKILHFYKTSFPDSMGGVEQVIDQIARGTAALGAEVDVLSLARKAVSCTTIGHGYRLHRARLDMQMASTGFSFSAFGRFAQLARQADIVHFHFPWPFMDVVHFMAGVRKPSVVTYHSDVIRQRRLLRLYRPLKRRFLASMDRIVATSPNYAATSGVLAAFTEKTRVIPIGVDKATYPRPAATRQEYWRQRVGARFFLFVGVLRYYKGLHTLLDAACGTGLPVVIVGSGPCEPELKAQAARLGLRNVQFLGQLDDDDKVALLQLCHGFVFPSHLRSEAFGISLLEAAMYGKPLVSCEIGTGTTFINVAGETGLVVPPGDAGALRQAMQFLWDNPERAAEFGRRAEDRYWRHFTATRMAQAYFDLYAGLVP